MAKKKTKKKASKKKTRRASRPRGPTPAQLVAAAYGSTLRGGDYSKAIAARAASAQNAAIAKQLGALTNAMYAKPAAAAVAPILVASGGGRNIALATAPRKKRASKRRSSGAVVQAAAARAGKKKRASKKVRSVTANAVVAEAQRTALKRWLCEGPRRSGCGAGGTRVIPFKGQANFVRLRPMRVMTGR